MSKHISQSAVILPLFCWAWLQGAGWAMVLKRQHGLSMGSRGLACHCASGIGLCLGFSSIAGSWCPCSERVGWGAELCIQLAAE